MQFSLQALRSRLTPHASGPHGGHGAHPRGHVHDHGGMATFIMDIDEIMAFTAPRVARLLEPPAKLASRGVARTANWAVGPNTVTPAQANRLGAHLAAGGGLMTVAGGIYYAYVAMGEAHVGMQEAGQARHAWQAHAERLAAEPAPAAPAAAPRSPTRSLSNMARHAATQARLLQVGKAGAVVGAAAMALTLVFSPTFLLTPFVPALALLSELCMLVAIPTMALYGIASSVHAVRALLQQGRSLQLAKAARTRLTEEQRAQLDQELARLKTGMIYEGLAGLGGLSLAAGLFLQLVSGPLGLALLAAGTFALEGFTFLRTATLGRLSPQTFDDNDRWRRLDQAGLLDRMDALHATESALVKKRPSGLRWLRSLKLRLGDQAGATELRRRLEDTLAALASSRSSDRTAATATLQSRSFVAAAPESDASLAAVWSFMGNLSLRDAFRRQLVRTQEGRAVLAAMGPQALFMNFAPVSEKTARCFYRAALEVLWNDALHNNTVAYGNARGLFFARL